MFFLLPTISFDYYRDCFLGAQIPEAEFAQNARKAARYVDLLCAGRLDGRRALADDVRHACCAVAEALYERETRAPGVENVLRERVGDIEVVYAAAKDDLSACLFRAAALHLWRSGLLSAAAPYGEVNTRV